MPHTLILAALLLYAVAAILGRTQRGIKLASVLMVVGLGLHAAAEYSLGIARAALPVGNIFEVLGLLSLLVIALQLGLSAIWKLRGLLSASCILAFVLGSVGLLGVSLNSAQMPLLHPALVHAHAGPAANPWVSVHAMLAILAYGFFSLSALCALVYVLHYHALKIGQFGGLMGILGRLPALQLTQRLSFGLLQLGLWALVLAIALGASNWWLNQGSIGATKLFLASMVGLLYASMYTLRSLNIWQMQAGQRAAWANIAVYITALAALGPLLH